MKAKYQGFEAKKSGGYVQLPPAGAYIGQILGVKVEQNFAKDHDQIVLMLDITEGDYKGRYMEVYNDQKERYQDVKYKGTLRITVPEPNDGDDKAWIKGVFQGNLWAVQDSNDGYEWDWDETKLKGKKVGFSVRNRQYTYNEQDRTTTEICRLESIKEIKAGRVKPAKDRDSRKAETDSGDKNFTDVSATVDVPF